MLKECLEVFDAFLQRKGENFIVDSHIPAQGTYLIIDSNGNCKDIVEVVIDKKTKDMDRTNPALPKVCFYDYQSQLISMNKPMDSKKIIHSNSYLSFAVKKESIVSGKLTNEIIDGYYDTLKNPLKKKYKKEACQIYKLFEEKEGEIDKEALEKNREWIKSHIFSLAGIDLSKKDYLKIFFEADDSVYEREARRYFLPNIYNSNDYNTEIEGKVYGMPDNNLGMNAKKPFLSIKSRKYPAPYLLNEEEVLFQKKFFDYLYSMVSAGKYHIYIDTEKKDIIACRNGEAPDRIETGYYLRIIKGKTEAEIYAQDNIPGYSVKLKKSFKFQNILNRSHSEYEHPEYEEKYKIYTSRLEVEQLINEVFFSKYLSVNYTMEAKDINITDGILKRNVLSSRDVIFDWVFKGIDRGIDKKIQAVSLDLIKGTLLKGYKERALWQLNLRYSFREYFSEGGLKMAEIITPVKEKLNSKVLSGKIVPIESDDEYYYAVGQLVAFLLSLSKSKDRNQSLLNPFMNAKTDNVIKKRIIQLYKKYNYKISDTLIRPKALLAMVEGYVPDANEVNQEMLILGYACDNVIYYKEEK